MAIFPKNASVFIDGNPRRNFFYAYVSNIDGNVEVLSDKLSDGDFVSIKAKDSSLNNRVLK